MPFEEARRLLGFPPGSRPTASQVKAAYRKKALESHPEHFPMHEKPRAESQFKRISEAYSCLRAGAVRGNLCSILMLRKLAFHKDYFGCGILYPFVHEDIISCSHICRSGQNWCSNYKWKKQSVTGQGSIPSPDPRHTFPRWYKCCKGISKAKGGAFLL